MHIELVGKEGREEGPYAEADRANEAQASLPSDGAHQEGNQR